MAPKSKTGVIEAGSAALRKVMTSPFSRKKDEADEDTRHSGRTNAVAEDPINSVIEREIIPRLMMAHPEEHGSQSGKRRSTIAASDANRFATLPLELEAASLLEEVDRFIDDGVGVEAVYLDLLAPAARRLGEMWEADECDFVDVTMGLWRLQEVMREIAARSPPIVAAIESPKSILVASMPGDQHAFGAAIVEEIFARAGWSSELLSQPERRELLDRLSHKAFDVVALTITRDCPSSAISSLIKAVRGISVNPDIKVLIGGHAINQNPAIVAEVGADGTGADARSALEVAERLVLAAPVSAQELR